MTVPPPPASGWIGVGMDRRQFLGAGLAAAAAGPSTFVIGGVADEWAELKRRVEGRVAASTAADFDRLREIYAARFDLTPGVIVQAASVWDVAETVAYARRRGLPLSVKSGGHSYAGYGLCDAGIALDLSVLHSVDILDQHRIRVGGGAKVGQIDQATAPLGRAAVLGQCPSVGIGGLTTGGGLGYLMSKHGIAADNLVEATVVTADSEVLRCSTTENADLFWALRGGGGNFGVVTDFTFQTHPVTDVLGGDLIFRCNQLAAFLHEFGRFADQAPPELTMISVIVAGPDRLPYFVVQCCYVGDPTDGARVLAPLRRSPHLFRDDLKVQSYLALQSRIGAVGPSKHINSTGAFTALSDPVIAALTETIAEASGRYAFTLVHHHGAAVAPPMDAMAFPLRDAGFSWGATASWREPAAQSTASDWVAAADDRLSPLGALAYVNTMDVESDGAVRAAYGSNYGRLAMLKNVYDASNLFQRNQNIAPAA